MSALTELSNKPFVTKLEAILRQIGRYRVVIFLLAVVGIYGFVLFQINALNSVQPTQDQINSQSNPIRTAHIDKKVVNQLQSLQDNSVNVKTLFDQARSNPFQEQP